jgi:hypothetical protein
MRCRGITLVELLVIVAVLGIMAALFLPPVGSRPPLTDKDLKLENWQPGPEHLALPPDSLRIRDINLVGFWTDRIGWTDMDIQPLEGDRYSILFVSHARCGLSGSVKLNRLGEFQDGVIVLDRPLRELTGTTYDRLYSVRINETACLLPSARVMDIQADTTEVQYRGVLSKVKVIIPYVMLQCLNL